LLFCATALAVIKPIAAISTFFFIRLIYFFKGFFKVN
jgi:hypothetical protein